MATPDSSRVSSDDRAYNGLVEDDHAQGDKPEHLTRPRSTELDSILGQPFKVLDQGFVRVVDYMGSDGSVVQAARLSYGAGTRRLHEDRGLIRYLMRNRHTTPFEMCELKLHVRVPMDCWRQWIRHRTANVNEYSTRYSVAIDAAQTTPPDGWRLQATLNKQGSEGHVAKDLGTDLSDRERIFLAHARDLYHARLNTGIAREQARKDLPLSTYTEAYWKIDLHNLLHFLSLRMDPHAQWEIRQYAVVVGEQIVARWCPMVWEAFQDYRLAATAISRIEVDVIRALIEGHTALALQIAKDVGWLKTKKSGSLAENRERAEFEMKLTSLGLVAPWNPSNAPG